MILDSQVQLSDAQSFTASGISTNIIDFGAARRIGSGEDLVIAINVDTAMAGTTPNVEFQWRNDNNATPTTPVSKSQTFTTLAAGSRVYLDVPTGVAGRYGALYVNLVSGTLSALAITAELTPRDMIQDEYVHASGWSVA